MCVRVLFNTLFGLVNIKHLSHCVWLPGLFFLGFRSLQPIVWHIKLSKTRNKMNSRINNKLDCVCRMCISGCCFLSFGIFCWVTYKCVDVGQMVWVCAASLSSSPLSVYFISLFPPGLCISSKISRFSYPHQCLVVYCYQEFVLYETK